MTEPSFPGFVRLFAELDATPSSRRKISLIADYLAGVEPQDAAWAVVLLAGRRRRRFVSSRSLRAAALSGSALPEWLFEECYAHVGDSAETVALLCAGKQTPGPDSPQLPESLHLVMERFIPDLAALDEQQRADELGALWQILDRQTAMVFNKLCTGGFRVGVSEKTVVRALSRLSGLNVAVLARRMTGFRDPSAGRYRELIDPEQGEIDAGSAYPFYLASPLEDASVVGADLTAWLFEWKWDGIRLQLIKRGGNVTLWSRGEETINDAFPELVEAAASLPDGSVLDGELLARSAAGGPAPFARLQRRLGRRKPGASIRSRYPVMVHVFDALEFGGEDIRERPIEWRRERAGELVAGLNPGVFRISEAVTVENVARMEDLRQGARERGVEGLMIKRIGSPYRVGRTRGEWWKFKADPFTLDVVLVYAQAGSGRRANLFTDYTFALRDGSELVTFAKAYSGLDDAEIARLDRWIRRNTVERYGPARAVRPEQVFEIAFEGIAPSSRHKSGLAVRFPRIVRWRSDKTAAEADSLEQARELARRANGADVPEDAQ